MKIVPITDVYMHIIWKLRIHTQRKSPVNTIHCPLFTPLEIMNIDNKIKVLVWF